jgi:hypothetical protein
MVHIFVAGSTDFRVDCGVQRLDHAIDEIRSYNLLVFFVVYSYRAELNCA